jgi:hypothetical protein
MEATSISISSLSVPTHRYVNSREFACATTPLMTDSVATCVVIILHDPTQKKGCLSHIDTDVFGETYGQRLPFLVQSIEAMVSRVGSSASALNLYALGGFGWFDPEAFHETMDSKFAEVMVRCETRLNNKKILYDPNGSPPVEIGDYAVTKAARTTNYEDDVDGYEDKGLLFQVTFGETESYAKILDVDLDEEL